MLRGIYMTHKSNIDKNTTKKEHSIHHYHDGETSSCEHDDHHHHDGEASNCEHDNHHHQLHQLHDRETIKQQQDSSKNKQVFMLENLSCANCASKMEAKIKQLPEVEDATIIFASKQLRVIADNPLGLIDKFQEICQSIEDGIKVVPRTKSADVKTKVYTIENLGCANCASKMERKINSLPEVEEATIIFATKQLRLTTKYPDALIPTITEICNQIEDNIIIKEKEDTKNTTKKKALKDQIELLTIVLGAFIFIGFEIYHEVVGIEEFSLPIIVILVITYLMLGKNVLLTAARNIKRGQIFDENFLMSIATIGAFAIENYLEAIGVMLFFRIGEYFEHIAVEKSRSQIMEAVDLRPETVNLVIDDTTRIIDANEAKVGDIVLVRAGDRIPLDGIVIEGETQLDTSAITGESIPIKVIVGSNVTSGSVNLSGVVKVKVEKILEESMVSRILDSVENAAASKPKIDNFITRFSRIYTPIVVALALFTALVVPLVTSQEFYPWIYTALTFLVMSCPCALVLSVPLAFFSGIGTASKKGILFKGGITLEALGNIKAVVMDKTGTITKGNFVVQKVTSKEDNRNQILSFAASCEMNSTHPIAISIMEEVNRQNISFDIPSKVEEHSGKGMKATINNQIVLCGNLQLMQDFTIDTSDYTANSGSEVLIAVDGIYKGSILIADTIKEEASSVIQRLKQLNLKTVMLTGDSSVSAKQVAQTVGIEEVYAKLLPHEKLETLQELREKYTSVMFVGDGINDAPVLANADVGAAMGSGADAAIEAADVVFLQSNMDAILEAIRISKNTNAIAKQNVIFAILIKVFVMIVGITGIYSNMWLAVFADTGVAFLCILNSIRILYKK